MKKQLFIFIQMILLGFLCHAQNGIGNLPFEITVDRFGPTFSSPTDISNAGDSRLFITQRNGLIRILNEDGTANDVPFLDIDDRVRNSGGQSEQGLLALEFHPDYATNGFFYVHYTSNDGNTVISRFEVDPNDENLADANSEEIIYTAQQPFTNHNGGTIKFGPDGMLYIGLGDGGSANDPQNLAQNTSSPMGKMLRIDVDNGLPYTIPADNPFINDSNVLDEIWSLGLRNPWKWSFDKLTGDMWIGDVGQNQWEEINFQPANSQGGENYGWRCREGAHDAITSGCGGNDFTEPIAEYNHLGFTHCSVTGGYVYRGAAQMFGEAPPIYLFADYCSSAFWGTYPDPAAGDEYLTAALNELNNIAISSFGEDVNGELYIAALNTNGVYKVGAQCNIDFTLNVEAASCTEASDGSITLFESDTLFYDLEIVNVNDPNGSYDPNALPPGNYTATVSRFGCEEVITQEVFIIERAPIGFEFDGGTTLSTTTSGSTYEWYLEGVLLDGLNTQSIEISASGNYSVVITEASGCVLPSDIFFVSLSNTQTIASLERWDIVPNPVEDKFTMTLEVNQNEQFTLSILDAAGKEVENRDLKVSGANTFEVDIADYTNGVYILMLSNDKGTQSKKIVKQ